MAGKVLFIIGGGPRVGHSVAKSFLSQGYKVALGRGNTEKTAGLAGSDGGVISVYTDVTKPGSIEAALREVKSKLGTPNVVVYNAAAVSLPPSASDPFNIPPASFDNDMAINTTGVFASLHYATTGFKTLKSESKSSSDTPYVFIATGNIAPFEPMPIYVTLAAGKAAMAYLISVGAMAYKSAGFRYYFASQVSEAGKVVPYVMSGDAHGDVYWKVVNGEAGGGRWDLRFFANSEGGGTEWRG